MSNTYYSSLSGMLAASYGLQNTSNNVSNMQSHGFKRTDVFYSSLGSGRGEDGIGRGVRVNGSSTNFNSGKYIQNNISTNLAVVGHGFFVVKLKSNEFVYTRDGEFEFKNGVLVDHNSGGQVQGYDSSGNLVPIYENGPKNTPGKGSHDVYINGNFCFRKPPLDPTKLPTTDSSKPGDTTNTDTKLLYEDVEIRLEKIYDDQGKAHTIILNFRNSPANPQQPNRDMNPENFWYLENVRSEDGLSVYGFLDQQIEFLGKGSSGTKDDYNNIQLLLNGKQTVNVYFGLNGNGENHSVKLVSAEEEPSEHTEIKIYQNDGYGVGTQFESRFNENGQITYYYDNGQEVEGVHIGLARFDNQERNLVQGQDNFFRAKTNKGIHYGRPNHNGFDVVRVGYLETSNVDSTEEFANIVVLQRMFQACSQIMDIDKQLLEELESKS